MNLISRSDAKEKGLKRFFTGVPCVNGHCSERMVCNGQCVECRLAHHDPIESVIYNKAYREENRATLNAYDKKRYAENVDERRDASRRYYKENAENLRAAKRAWQDKNRVSVSARRKATYIQNRESILAANRVSRMKNPGAIRARVKAWRRENPEKKMAQHAKRRAIKNNAAPIWASEFDEFVWVEAAHLVVLRRAATGFNWASDHMIPLASRTACGLHVALNCQVITAKLNNQKHNKLILTEPLEWLKYL